MRTKTVAVSSLAILFVIVIWAIIARLTAIPFIIPSPRAVARDFIYFLFEKSFAETILPTFYRVLCAFFLSLILSFLLGVCAGLSSVFRTLLTPWLSVIKSTPVVAVILIAILWFGSDKVPVFVAILMTLPVMTESTIEGILKTDKGLLEMAHAYHFRRIDKLLYVQLPSALPYLLTGAGTSVGLTWKVVIAGEILSIPRHGIGSEMQTAKIQLETVRVFSLTLLAILISVCTEALFRWLIKQTTKNIVKVTKKGT